MKDLKGKSCLLTGASSGIGRSLAFGLAREGMNLFLTDIDMDNLEKVKAELEKSGTTVHIARCDVSKYEDIENLAQQFYSKFDYLDLLINNAGIAGAGLVETLEIADWKHVLDVNLWSIIYAVKAFLPRMLKQGGGHFVNVASGAGVVGIPYHIQYVASKFSVVGITEALYCEIGYRGIRFSAICPSQLKTNIIDRTPLKLTQQYIKNVSQEEIDGRMPEFKKLFWEKYIAHAMPVDVATARYIEGIKKDKLYIFDSPLPRLAMYIKSVSQPLYKRVLRREREKVIKMIKGSLEQMGLEYQDI